MLTAYLDRPSAGGHGFIDRLSSRVETAAAGMSNGGYVDVYPGDPLRVTLYAESMARTILERAGWATIEVLDPSPVAQHTILAAPLTD